MDEVKVETHKVGVTYRLISISSHVNHYDSAQLQV